MEEYAGPQISEEVAGYARAVIAHFDDTLDHLSEARIAYLLTDEELKIRGKYAGACVFMPDAQGQNRRVYHWALARIFGDLPDVIMVVQREFWEECDDTAKVALVYHELRHIRQHESSKGPCFSKEDGRPILKLVDHDLGEFNDVARLFGEWEPGLTRFRQELTDQSERVNVAEILARLNRVSENAR